jgi:hypothetical protein
VNGCSPLSYGYNDDIEEFKEAEVCDQNIHGNREIELDVPYVNEHISWDSKEGYIFATSSATRYCISMTNLTADADWYLFVYKSDCWDNYPLSHGIAFSKNSGNSDEIFSVSLNAFTKYQIIVNNSGKNFCEFSLYVMSH